MSRMETGTELSRSVKQKGVKAASEYAAKEQQLAYSLPSYARSGWRVKRSNEWVRHLTAASSIASGWRLITFRPRQESAAVCALAASPTSFDTGLAVLNTPHKKHHWDGSALGIGD